MLIFEQRLPDMELLLVYDEEQKYRKNFYLCMTQEAADRVLGKKPATGQSKRDGNTEDSKWVSQGSEEAIREENVYPSRELVSLSSSS